MSFKNKSDGYTLIELIVTTVIVGIVSTILVYLLISIFGTLQENRTRKQLLMEIMLLQNLFANLNWLLMNQIYC